MEDVDRIALQQWIASRDAEAFKELTTRYAGIVYATCRRILGNSTDAEDITQECFEILAQAKEITRIHSVGAWLHGMATNRSIKRIRSDHRGKSREACFSSISPRTTDVTWNDLYEYVDEAVCRLPMELREPILLHFFEDNTHESIAKKLGVARSTISYRIQMGIETIRKQLKRQGIVVAGSALTVLMTRHLVAEAVPTTLTATLARIGLAGVTRTNTAGAWGFIYEIMHPQSVMIAAALLFVAALASWALYTRHTTESTMQTPQTATLEAPTEPLPLKSVQPPPVINLTDAQNSNTPLVAPTTEATSPNDSVSSSAVGTIHGAMRYRGTPMAGMAIQLNRQEKCTEAKTDKAGTYIFEDVPPGQYTLLGWLSPSREDRFPQLIRKEQITLKPGTDTIVDFDFPAPGGFLEGVLTYQGQPIEHTSLARCELRVTDEKGTEVYANGTGVGPNGRYAFEKVNGGSALFEAWATLSVEGVKSQLRYTCKLKIPEGKEVFRTIEMDKQKDSLIVHLQGNTEHSSGSLTMLRGKVDIEFGKLSEKYLESFSPLIVTYRDVDRSDACQFGPLEPGTYTLLLMAIDRKYLDKPEKEQIENGQFLTKTVSIIAGQTQEVTFFLE